MIIFVVDMSIFSFQEWNRVSMLIFTNFKETSPYVILVFTWDR